AVRVPAAEANGYEARARFDQAACGEGALAEGRPPERVAHGRRLLLQIERLARPVGAEDIEGLLVELVEAGGQIALVEGFERRVELVAQLVAVGEVGGRKAVG